MSSTIRKFLGNSARILKLATKPGRSEFLGTIKVSLLGFGIIGLLGFLIQLIATVAFAGG
ncbi:MAG: protein translocase SEC61 complex subunit gamma [Candidatus Ranarchaeia archaeon]